MTEWVIWLLMLGAGYSYGVYPVLLLALTRLPGADKEAGHADSSGVEAPVSFIVTARNEAARIEGKIRDLLAHAEGWPSEILIVSDASEDETDELVRGMGDDRVRLIRQEARGGKEAAQKLGIDAARGEILVFSDVSTRIAPGSLEALMKRFRNPCVGAVSSEDRFESPDGTLAGEGLYVRYEMWLRRLESRLAGLVGLSGSFFAVRRSICDEWRTDVPSDFTVALTCARRGLKAVSDPAVIGVYRNLRNTADEYARKRRTVLRGMAGLSAAREVLNPATFGMFSWQVWSHKMLRWAVPWFLLLLFVTSCFLAPGGGLPLVLLAGQAVGCGLAVLASVSAAVQRLAFARFAYYFCQVNLAMAEACLRFIRGERVVTWEPSRR
ncbi:glycosyltransferase [Lentisalinibacter sediminis]|uniref:glycosyltransferase n=1 Tax=Lentisalinibacter sediminis TaxID=2992237 RepID=UPI0038644B7C